MGEADRGPDPAPMGPLHAWRAFTRVRHVPWNRLDAWTAWVLGTASLLIAYPFRARFLTTWDSSLFALAIEDYDLMAGHPHPPGYPVFILLCKMAYVLTGEANAAIVLVSLVFGAATLGLFYALLRQWVAPAVAVATTALLAVSPNLVYDQLIAVSYMAESAVAVGIAWLAWRLRTQPSRWDALALAALFGLGIGLRTSIGLFLSPLVAWALLARPADDRSWRTRAIHVTCGGLLGVVSWLVPMAFAAGGIRVWLETTSLQSRVVLLEHTVFNDGFSAVRDHTQRILFFLDAETGTLGLLFAMAAACALVMATRRTQVPRLMARHRNLLTLLSLWLAPAFAFYMLIFSGWGSGPRGYVLVVLPAIYASLALLGQFLLNQLRVPRRREALGVAAACMILLLPALDLAPTTRDLVQKEVKDHDSWSESWLQLRSTFPSNETAILTTYSWAFVKWYFPEYTAWGHLRPPRQDHNGTWDLVVQTRAHRDDVPFYRAHLDEKGVASHPIPSQIRRIVVFDFQIAGENEGKRLLQDDIAVHEGRLSSGWRILYIEVDPQRPDIESYLKLGAES